MVIMLLISYKILQGDLLMRIQNFKNFVDFYRTSKLFVLKTVKWSCSTTELLLAHPRNYIHEIFNIAKSNFNNP